MPSQNDEPGSEINNPRGGATSSRNAEQVVRLIGMGSLGCTIALTVTGLLGVGLSQQKARASSEEPSSLAWRAFNAAEAGDRSEIPALEQALASLQDDTGREQEYARLAALDALIRLDAKPPLDMLAGAFDVHPVQTLLMLKRFGAERDQITLALFQRSKGHRWFALANLLQATKAAGFASHLLTNFSIQLTVSVSDDGHRGSLGSGGLSAICGCGGAGLSRGSPPLATYRFSSRLERGAELLTDGVQSTYYVRDLSRAGETPFASSCDISGPTSRDRFAELSAMLGGESVPLKEVEFELVAWSDAADLTRRVTAAKRRVEGSYSALVERLRVKGWLTATEAGGLHPDIRVEMHDLRADQSQRLPVP